MNDYMKLFLMQQQQQTINNKDQYIYIADKIWFI